MDFTQFDPEKLQAELDAANEKKRNLALVGGIGDRLASQQSFGNFYLGRMNPQSDGASKTADAMASTITDPIERQGKLYQAFKSSQEAQELKNQTETQARKRDPNSRESMALKMLAPRWGIKVTPEMSAADIEQMIDPKKMMETEATSRISNENQKALQDRQFGQQKELEILKQRGDLEREALKNKTDEAKKTRDEQVKRAEKDKKFTDRYKSIMDEIANLDALVEKDGTAEVFGSHEAKLKQKLDSIAIDSAKLFDPESVARESEVAAFKNMLFAPGSYGTADSTARDILKSYKEMLKQRAESQLGYLPEGYQYTSEERKALEWASANSNDPRAKKIIDRLNTKVGQR